MKCWKLIGNCYLQVCADINECENSNGGCVENSNCINTPVSDALWSIGHISRATFKAVVLIWWRAAQ